MFLTFLFCAVGVFILHGYKTLIYCEVLSCIFGFVLFYFFIKSQFLKFKIEKIKQYALSFEKHSSDTLNTILFPCDLDDKHFLVAAKSKSVNILGGDFYHFLLDKNGNYWFVIGDSCGMDLSSHIFSVLIVNYLNYFINIFSSPKDVVEKINEELLKKNLSIATKDQEKTSLYSTIVVLKSDTKGNFEHYGLHPNPVLLRKNLKIKEIIETTGIFVGFPENSKNLPTGKFKLNSKDRLFLFTDGIFEQKNKKNVFFGEKIYDFIEKQSDKPEVNIESLFQEVSQFSENSLSDDMTFVVIEKK